MSSVEPLPDVIVVGAGVIGLSTALALLRRGRSVTLVERGRVGPGGASWAAGGILFPLDPADVPAAAVGLLKASLAAQAPWYAQLASESGIDPEFETSGLCVQPPLDRAGWPALAAALDQPVMEAGDELLLPEVAQVRSPRLLRALAEAVRRRGGRLLEGRTVLGLVGDTRITGVETPEGTLSAGAVVLAAGAWSSMLDPSTRIGPVKGQMLLFDAPGLLRRILLRDHMYLIPRRDGGVVAGSTLETAGFDDAPTAQGLATILAAVRRMAPALADRPVVAHWAGLRPAPVGGLPRVGASGRDGLFLNCGHHRVGITLAPGSALQLADALG